MIIKNKKTSVKWAGITMLSLVLLTGCSSSPGPAAGTNAQNTTVTENSSESSQDSATQAPLVVDSQDESVTLSPEPSSDSEADSFQSYLDLLGMSKQDLINNINEKPASIDKAVWNLKKTESESGLIGIQILLIRYI
ncbi:MAG: hypothetical protein QM683_23255 [Lacrimispora sp.]